jgi:hypothetical protein
VGFNVLVMKKIWRGTKGKAFDTSEGDIIVCECVCGFMACSISDQYSVY